MKRNGEPSMLSLLLGAICFAGIHFGVAGTTLRDRAIAAALGEGAYRAVFSIVSLVAIVWLVMAYMEAPYVATWGIPERWKPIAMILMLPAFLLAVIGLTTPNPTSVGQEGRVGALAGRHRAGYTPSIPHWRRIVGGGASGRQRRCRLVHRLWRLCRHRTGRNRVDRRQASPRLVRAGRPSRRKPLSSRSRRLPPAVPGSTPVRSRHGDGSPPSLPTP